MAYQQYFLTKYGLKPQVSEQRNTVGLGATVSVESQGQDYQFEITNSYEADPAVGKISAASPIGSVLIGHRIGDAVPINEPISAIYRICRIQYKIS